MWKKGRIKVRVININNYVKLPEKIVDWFDKNMFYGVGIKSGQRPDLERGMLLYYLCKKIKAKKCLDVGTGSFFSARSMAKSGADVDTIDINGEKNPNDGWDNITFYKGDSGKILPNFIEEGRQYDIIFIDGDHGYEGVKKDLINAKKLTKLIVAHDYGNLPEVTRAINEELGDDFDFILEDRMWKGAPYENGIDKNGNTIDYGVVVWRG